MGAEGFNHLGQQDFIFMGGPETGPFGGGFGNGFDNIRMSVTEDKRAPGATEVEIFVIVGVENIGSLPFFDIKGCSANSLEGPDG